MTGERLLLAAAAVFGIASPYLGIPGWTPSLATVALFTALSLIGLNLIFGYCGMLALGQAAFSALSGYGAGILYGFGMPSLIAALSGFMLAVAAGRLVAEIFIRLPGIYLAVGTLGFAYVVEGLARAFPAVTGGASGLILTPPFPLGERGWYVLAVVVLTIATASVAMLVRGRTARMLRLVHRDELAAAVAGIDVVKLKVRIFTIGAAYSAAGGLFLVHYTSVIAPEMGGANTSLEYLAMVIIGGAGSIAGPILGAVLTGWLFSVAGAAAEYELLVYGASFLAVILFAPAGVAGIVRRMWGSFTGKSREPEIPVLASSDTALEKTTPIDNDGLRVVDISKRFGGLHAVQRVSLEAKPGEVVALLGPNGAGKSTLFNILSGIERPDEGSIFLEGKPVTDLGIHERAMRIGRSFQLPRLVVDMSVLQNVVIRADQLYPNWTETDRLGARQPSAGSLRPRAPRDGACERGRGRSPQAHRHRAGRIGLAAARPAGRACRRTFQRGARPVALDHPHPEGWRLGGCGCRPQRRLHPFDRRSHCGHGERRIDCGRAGGGRDRRSTRAYGLHGCADMSNTLMIERLSGGYGKLCVFRDVDFAIADGETVGIFGPNGAGKTTLLSTVVGLLPSQAGRIVLDGEDLTTVPAYRRARKGIGLAPEGRQVLSTLTVHDNLELVRAAAHRSEEFARFDERVAEMFRLFPRLKERKNQLSGTLSGGEQQMLAIARALLVKPKLLMLDEPTQGLAPVIVRELESTLRQLKGRFSMIVVEQNKAFLDSLADRLLGMRAGQCSAKEQAPAA